MTCITMKAFIAAALAWYAEVDALRIMRRMEPNAEARHFNPKDTGMVNDVDLSTSQIDALGDGRAPLEEWTHRGESESETSPIRKAYKVPNPSNKKVPRMAFTDAPEKLLEQTEYSKQVEGFTATRLKDFSAAPSPAVIFLDVDGVLNEDVTGKGALDKSYLANLLTLFKYFPSVEVVMSSSWRDLGTKYWQDERIQGAFDRIPFRGVRSRESATWRTRLESESDADKTKLEAADRKSKDTKDYRHFRAAQAEVRADQIRDYVATHDIQKYIILDDMTGLRDYFEANQFVDTSNGNGNRGTKYPKGFAKRHLNDAVRNLLEQDVPHNPIPRRANKK